MSDIKYYIQDIKTREYVAVDKEKKIILSTEPYIWVASPTDADNEFTFKDSNSDDSWLSDSGKEFGLGDKLVDGSLWWTNAKPL